MRVCFLATLLCCSGLSHATERMQLFDRPHADEEATRRASAVASSCAYSEMSRIGPSDEQVARCNKAEEKLLALGTRAIPAVLHALDDGRMSSGAVNRSYDVLARAGDPSIAASLVDALEKLEAHPDSARAFERWPLKNALERLTHAGLGAKASARDWRAWIDAHRDRPAKSIDPQPDGKPVG